MRDRVSGVMVQ